MTKALMNKEREMYQYNRFCKGFKVLVLCQDNCSFTKPVLCETLLINLFAGAESANLLFLPSLFVEIYCASALPWLKPRLIAFISLVWYRNCIETHTDAHRVSLCYTRFCTRYTMYQIKMNLHGSKWDRPNWQWGFSAVPTAYSMQGLLSWNQTSLHSKGWIKRKNVKDKEPRCVLLAAYTKSRLRMPLCISKINCYNLLLIKCVLTPCVRAQLSTWLAVFIITAYRRCC